ncbi:MAG: hypothetical protein A2147_03615 [Chloroflexi bacterium RBG_16_57_8]|nr:MAG: hypothetical protein A2147_03615 [Chloroflexi bacterium RBG_16_57_8]
MPKDIVVEQADIEVDGRMFTVTRIPTATSGSWFVIHDAFEVWAALAIEDATGEIAGWRNPPDKLRTEIENAVKACLRYSPQVIRGGYDN